MLFLLKLAPLAVSMEMLLTLVRIDQIEIYLLFLIEDELFVQICLNQWRKESVTALFLGILRFFIFCTFLTASTIILKLFSLMELIW